MVPIPTIPLVKSCTPFEGERFLPDRRSPLFLSAAGLPEPKLNAAVRSLFPEQECREVPADGLAPYTLQWGRPPVEPEPHDVMQLPSQGYSLTMRGRSASIRASDAAGLFYGMQTLRQLLDGLAPGAALEAATIVDWPDVALRCMNYDLRQTFSKPELLIGYVDRMASFKANALLIEYEDKFPFVRHRDFRHPRHALTEEELGEMLDAAERNFIEVIPLQQSFGHLEYILGREEYKHLRETESSVGELCPVHPESFSLVAGLLEEMSERHPRSRYLHLGCDEVYSLCECPACRERFGGSRNLAFLDFVNRLIDYACGLGKRPIIWQDILADCSDEELALLDPRVTVMIWHYNGKNVSRLVSPLAARLQELGVEVMGAPAVRCFDRMDDQNYPLVGERISNIEQWANVAAEQRLAGLVGTNWSAVFSLGVPYGVFETSWYTMAYFADASWNRKRGEGAEEGGRAGGSGVLPFISRFLRVFHGIAPNTALRLLGNHDDEDYYSSMPQLLDAIEKNAEVAALIASLVDFEKAADRSRTVHKYVYRHRLYPDSEPEWRSLSNNYRITRKGLRLARERISEALRAFLPADMAEHYMLSRFYLHDYLDENLYRSIGLREE